MPQYPDGTLIHKAEWDRLLESIPASYVVWKDGSQAKAECLLKSGTDYTTGTDDAVLQAAVDALTSGGRIFVKAGTYSLTNGIYVRLGNIIIDGQGRSTLFTIPDWTAAGAYRDWVFGVGLYNGNNMSITLRNFAINGNKDSQTRIFHGVNVYETTSYVTLSNLMIYNCTACAVQLTRASNVKIRDNFLINNNKVGIDGPVIRVGNGIVDQACYDVLIDGNTIYTSGGASANPATGVRTYYYDKGIRVLNNYIYGGGDGITLCDSGAIVKGNHIESTLYCGISVSGANGAPAETGNYFNISNNRIKLSGQSGIKLFYADYNIINDNEIADAVDYGINVTRSKNNIINCNYVENSGYGKTPPTGLYGILLSDDTTTLSLYNMVEGNILTDTQGTKTQSGGLIMSGGADYATIIGNDVIGNDVNGMVLSGTHNIVRHNRGYVTENSGTSEGTGAEQTIAHGLATGLTPNLVTVVPTVTGATVSSVWADATNIYCTVTDDKAFKWTASII